jgi:hypothetical protein
VSDPADDLSDAPPLTLSSVNNPLVYTFAPHVRVHHPAEAEHDSADADARPVFAFDPAISLGVTHLELKSPQRREVREENPGKSLRSPAPLLVAGSRLRGSTA